MPTRFLARMSSHQHCLLPRHGHALLGMRTTGPRLVSHLQWVSAHMHRVSSSNAQAYVLQSGPNIERLSYAATHSSIQPSWAFFVNWRIRWPCLWHTGCHSARASDWGCHGCVLLQRSSLRVHPVPGYLHPFAHPPRRASRSAGTPGRIDTNLMRRAHHLNVVFLMSCLP